MENHFFNAIVLDDDLVWLGLMDRLVSRLGFHVYKATNANEVYELIRSVKNIPVMIADIRLSDDDEFNIDGLNIIRKLLAESKLKYGLVITGYPSEDTKDMAEALGIKYFVKGNFSRNEFWDELGKTKEKLMIN